MFLKSVRGIFNWVMNKMIRISKMIMSFVIILLLGFQTFAVVVSDNDGSAFITKAEFDSLKNNFQSQINQYNVSVDSKIDAAISSYLVGIKVEKTETISTNFNTIMQTNYWEGIKNLKESDVIDYFGKVTKANWIYGGSGIVASFDTAKFLDNMSANDWPAWDSTDTNYGDVGNGRFGWHMYRYNVTRSGDGHALWGDADGSVKQVTENTYVNVADNMFSRYQYSNSNTTMWYEQRGTLEYGKIYENTNSSNIRNFGFSARGANDPNSLKNAWRKYCGCTIDVRNIPIRFDSENYAFFDSQWVADGVITERAADRTTTKLGSFSASLKSGKDISFICKSNPKVILYSDEKKYFKIYPDTDLDYTEVVSDLEHAVYGTTDDVFTAERVQNNLCILVPVLGPENIDNSGSNYFDLQKLRVNQYEQLQNDKSKNLHFADGIPLAYISKEGEGKFNLRIKNNSPSETFTNFEVKLSKKPFSKAADSDIISISSIKVGDTTVPYVPVDQEATISFKLDEKNQVYLWWQAKDEDYGGMLTEVSDIDWTTSD